MRKLPINVSLRVKKPAVNKKTNNKLAMSIFARTLKSSLHSHEKVKQSVLT